MKWKLVLTTVLFGLLLTSCTAEADTETAPPETETAEITEKTEMNAPADTESVTVISAAAESLRITEGGEHRLTGTYDGMVTVDAGTYDVTLVLDGADITSSGKAAVYVKSAGNVTVTLADGSENTLTGRKGIHSEAALLLNGGGSLTVTASEGHGIIAKSAIAVENGTYSITAAKDGIHAENETDPTLADILLTGGNFMIVSGGDGVSASGTLQTDDTNGLQLLVSAGGGAENAEPHADDMGWGGGRGFFGWGWDSSAETEETADENAVTSFKALKSDGDMTLNGGMFTLDSAEDTIHTNADLTVNGGTYHLSAGDDAVHADLALTINGGLFQILESYEGIEAKTIDVNGGELHVKASDDGFNASGGTSAGWNMMAAEEGVYFRVSGGTIFLDADGDGLDSNGDFFVTGGEIYVAGPTNSGNGALDYGGEAVAEGGVVIAAGASGMAESFGANSTQGAIMVNTGNQPAGSAVTLTDEAGNVLAEYTFGKTFSNVVITAPEIVADGTYTVTAGTYSETITMDGLLYGSGGGMSGGGGMNMGGGRGNGGKKDRTERGEVPEMPENGEVPAMPEGEVPEMPQMPEGFDPGVMGGGRPELPEGEIPPDGMGGGRPGGMGMGGEPPQMP